MKRKYFYVIISSLVLGTILFHQNILTRRFEKHIFNFESQTNIVKKIDRFDRKHKQNIEKVVSILKRFNPSLDDATKRTIADEICGATLKYDNLDVDLICATITHESAYTWNPKVVSRAGALGLMQIMPKTGRSLAKLEGIEWTTSERVLFDPVVNIRLGTRYLSSLIELYEVDGGLAAYNGGSKRAARWLSKNRASGVLHEETQNYVPAVLSLYEEFQE